MSTKYLPQQFEQKWMEIWEKEGVYKTTSLDIVRTKITKSPSKKYCLPMFPYPSGAGLHVGHVRIYTGCDVVARYFRMKGHSVLHPIGWDAFGLPAENAAIKTRKNPMDMVAANIDNFRRQMKALGFSYDWEREAATCDPDYYRWTQWLFIQFFKMGLLYKKNTPINFCPFCKTGLAEEEVLSDGTHERCGNLITKKELPQWIFRITTYADRLLSDLEGLDWPAGILQMQKNWIGRKEGIIIKYKVVDPVSEQPQKIQHATFFGSPRSSPPTNSYLKEIECFTTRPDTNFGATFIVLAPEHTFVQSILNKKLQVTSYKLQEIKRYVETTSNKTEMERVAEGRKKTGVFTGFYAVNNLNGRPMPIWISDFVLGSVGTGAVVGVPGHDRRDFEFAQTFNLDIIRVVVGRDGDQSPITCKEQVQEEEGLMINSDFLNGLDIHTATKKIMDYLEEKGWGKRVTTYHLRDWIFSRQRYWGEPIPMIDCKKCGWAPVSEEDLPVKLPYVKSYEPNENGQSPLAEIKSFVKTACPHCGGEARRETDTMPNWAGSCWYFIRFAQMQSVIPSQAEESLSSIKRIPPLARLNRNDNMSVFKQTLNSPWLPVDWYFGGAEHAVLHLLYARFWVKALYDLGLLNFKEPFLKLRNVGMVIAEDHRKMSKSFGNVINPDEVVAEYGADSLRIYEMFMAPFDSEISWSTAALQGAYRFLTRIWQIYNDSDNLTDDKNNEDKQLVFELQRVIYKVSTDIPNVKFNTAVAAMMGFLNKWERQKCINPDKEVFVGVKAKVHKGKSGKLSKENGKKFLQILAPFAPFMSEEIWRTVFGETASIHLSSWPEAELTTVRDQILTIPVQVNGKLRATITISSNETSQSTVVKKALTDEKVKRYIEGKNYKVVYVKGKVLNLVV